MAGLWFGLFLFGCLPYASSSPSNDPVLTCYFTDWAQYRPGAGRFDPSNIDTTLCTHINYAFAQVDLTSHTIQPYEWNDKTLYAEINGLKETQPDLKTLISVGGWNHEDQPRFSNMVQTQETRKIFIDSLIPYIQENGFDGVSIDWEYPAVRPTGTPSTDKQKFTLLLQEVRERLNQAGQSANRTYHLTIAGGANGTVVDLAYEVSEIAKYVDWVSVMAYDLHGSWENVTGHITAMKGSIPTVPYAIKVWLDKGLPANQLVLGTAAYGRTFTLSTSKAGIGAPVSGPGLAGLFTQESGCLAFYEICSKRWDSFTDWDVSVAGAPYASGGNQWVGYDTVASMRTKAQLVVSENLRGAMFWALDMDDFTGTFCATKTKYPLLTELANVLHESKRKRESPAGKVCVANSRWSDNKQLQNWCQTHCISQSCPVYMCECRYIHD